MKPRQKKYKVVDWNSKRRSGLGDLTTESCRVIRLNGEVLFEFREDGDIARVAIEMLREAPCYEHEQQTLDSALQQLQAWLKQRYPA
jgi:hypothetical protein